MVVEFAEQATNHARSSGQADSGVDDGRNTHDVIDQGEFADLERALGVRVDNALLARALTHRSSTPGHSEPLDFGRLEFLGDAVLGLVVTEALIRRYPDLSEGGLAKRRAAIINMVSLASLARDLNIGPHIRLGRSEEAAGGRDKPSILADTLEALIGAVHLDRGSTASSDLVHRLIDPIIEYPVPARVGDGPDSAVLLDHPRHEEIFRSRFAIPGLQERLRGLLDTLTEREAGIMSMRFGLRDGQPRTVDQISEIYGVTRDHVLRIESTVMAKIRDTEDDPEEIESPGYVAPRPTPEPRGAVVSASLSPASSTAGLSRREAEVAFLVTEGYTNQEIAARLHITDRTVETHLSRIFRKLGVTSRVGAVNALTRPADDSDGRA